MTYTMPDASKPSIKRQMENKIMTAKEAAKYTRMSVRHIYKLTMRKQIPHYKPTGGRLYFDSQELDEWMHTDRKEAVK